MEIPRGAPPLSATALLLQQPMEKVASMRYQSAGFLKYREFEAKNGKREDREPRPLKCNHMVGRIILQKSRFEAE